MNRNTLIKNTYKKNHSYATTGRLFGLSRQRVYQIINEGSDKWEKCVICKNRKPDVKNQTCDDCYKIIQKQLEI